MTEIKIIVADGHLLFMEGICSILKEESEIEVKGACTVKDAIKLTQEFAADIILLDFDLILCNGTTLPKFILQNEGKASILIMSEGPYNENLFEILRAGAKGFIKKSISRNDLLLAIRTIAKGDYYLCKEAANVLINHLCSDHSTDEDKKIEQISNLSKREKDILKFISFGFTNSEIAEKLFISAHTVATHRRNLLQKINVKNTAGLVRYASKLGLLN
jgi:DNA-binding NarL/FixJ family response regulator